MVMHHRPWVGEQFISFPSPLDSNSPHNQSQQTHFTHPLQSILPQTPPPNPNPWKDPTFLASLLPNPSNSMAKVPKLLGMTPACPYTSPPTSRRSCCGRWCRTRWCTAPFMGLSLVIETIRFLDKDDAAKIRESFTGLWSLDDLDAIKAAMEKPDLFVLKPQREGGGNNIYGENVRETLIRLQKEGSEEPAAFILIQRIFPKTSLAYMIRDGICYEEQAISELGTYGANLRNKGNVIVNDHCGHLMRTKVSSSNEGGVAAGFAVLDGIYLI